MSSGGLELDWVRLPATAHAAGRSVGELQVRRRTGVTIVAVLRGSVPIVDVGPDTVLRRATRSSTPAATRTTTRSATTCCEAADGTRAHPPRHRLPAGGLLARAGRRVGLPTIPFFIAAGILVGPHTAGPVLFDRPKDLELLAAFGLIFLLFYLGVEFSLDDLTGGGRLLLASAGLYLVLNLGAGLAFGFALGWGSKEALVIAGATGISSSAIVTKLLVELRRLGNPETRLILGIIVLEDLFLALYLATLAPILGQADGVGESIVLFVRPSPSWSCSGWSPASAPRVVGVIITSKDDELLVVLFVGFALLVAGIAYELGVSDAIGAFMAGLVLAGTAAARRIQRLVLPLRDGSRRCSSSPSASRSIPATSVRSSRRPRPPS